MWHEKSELTFESEHTTADQQSLEPVSLGDHDGRRRVIVDSKLLRSLHSAKRHAQQAREQSCS